MNTPTYPGPETIHRYELDNGITLLVYENFVAPTVVVEGVVRAGAIVEDRAQAGLAAFTAAMLMRGTEKRSFGEIYEALESAGASLGFSSSRNMTDFSANLLAEDFDLILNLVNESLRYPTFPADHVERVRGEIMTSLQMRANDTRSMATLLFQETLYAGHPYGQSMQGYPETVSQFTRDDLAQFHQNYYGPQGMLITIVGAIKKEDALSKVKAIWGDWQNLQQRPLPPIPDAPAVKGRVVKQHPMPEKTQSDVVLGWAGPRRAAADYMHASLANTVLGVFGMMGRLGETVREKQGLAYYVHSRMQGGLGPSPWFVSTGVAPQNVEQAIDSILAEVQRIQEEKVPDDELADSKAYRTGSLPVSLETNDAIATNLLSMELYSLGLDYLQKYSEMYGAIGDEAVQAAAQKYLDIDNLVIVVAGP